MRNKIGSEKETKEIRNRGEMKLGAWLQRNIYVLGILVQFLYVFVCFPLLLNLRLKVMKEELSKMIDSAASGACGKLYPCL